MKTPTTLKPPSLLRDDATPGSSAQDLYEKWLHTPGSLTQVLRQDLKALRVEVLASQARATSGLESQTLNAPFLWQRDVLLWGQTQPYVFARTRVADTSAENMRMIQTLGSQPLGDHLFLQASLQKISFTILREPELTGFISALPYTLGHYYPRARETLYEVCGGRILITEIFLDTHS